MSRKTASPKRKWNYDDLAYAFECAAEFLELEEWPDDDAEVVVAAYKEAAQRIRRMAERLPVERGLPSTQTRSSDLPPRRGNTA